MADSGFGKRNRLLNAADFTGVFEHTEIKAACSEVLLLARHNELGRPRLGLVIAKKQVKLATRRNRLKRLIRESFRTRQQQLPALDVVVLVRRGLAGLENDQVSVILDKQWARLCKRAAQQGESKP